MRFCRLLLQSPTRISICGFLILISIGTVLLMLPAASASKSLSLVDALFTATSASCVTGLIVVDTGRSLSHLGQYVIIVLIQAGGLGIMTISTLFLLIAGRRPSLTGQVVIQDTFTRGGDRTVGSILKDVALFTFVFEALGTVLLFFRFFPERSMGEALYLAVFHAISAFCNAGFSVFADSFAGYRNEWILNLVICFLIIQDLDLINRLGIQIIAVKEVIKDQLILIPTAKFVIKDSDILIMLGRNESLEKLKGKAK